MSRSDLFVCGVVAAVLGLVGSSRLAWSADPSLDGMTPISNSYGEIKQFMQNLVKAHPKNARTFEVGYSDSGEIIEGIAIGNGPLKNLVVAAHHGNEYGSTEVAKGVAASFSANPIGGQTVFIIPVLNINGYNARSRREAVGPRTFDSNRDYPGPCGGEGPFNLKSTHALANFVANEGIVTAATFHTFHPAVVYPWGLSSRDLSTVNDDLFKYLAQLAVVDSHYEVGNSTEVIYPANGTFEDYAYWQYGVWAMLFELGNSHRPSQSAVDDMVKVNVPGVRNMLANAPAQRAEKHDFTGTCDDRAKYLDLHDE